MKGKVPLAIVIVLILVASLLIAYYVEFGLRSNSSSGAPSLVYDFNSTISYDDVTMNYYGGSFLGWNCSGYVTNNETDAVAIHYPGSLSRQFEALGSRVNVTFDWSIAVAMVVSRQLKGVYGDLKYANDSVDNVPHTYAAAFDVDNGTTFTVRFEPGAYPIAFLYRVKLWDSAEFT